MLSIYFRRLFYLNGIALSSATRANWYRTGILPDSLLTIFLILLHIWNKKRLRPFINIVKRKGIYEVGNYGSKPNTCANPYPSRQCPGATFPATLMAHTKIQYLLKVFLKKHQIFKSHGFLMGGSEKAFGGKSTATPMIKTPSFYRNTVQTNCKM